MITKILDALFREKKKPEDAVKFDKSIARLRKTMAKHCKEIEDHFGDMVVDMQRGGAADCKKGKSRKARK